MSACVHKARSSVLESVTGDNILPGGPPETTYMAETKAIGLEVKISHKYPVFRHPRRLTTPLKGIRRMTFKTKYYKLWPKTTIFPPLNPEGKTTRYENSQTSGRLTIAFYRSGLGTGILRSGKHPPNRVVYGPGQ